METGAIASRYAVSFYEYLFSTNQLEQVYSDVKKLINLLRSHPELRIVLTDRSLGVEGKTNLLNNLLNESIHPVLKNLIALLEKRDRIENLLQVLLIFRKRYLESKSILDVELELPVELETETLERVKNKISSALNSRCEIEIRVKPELVAGYALLINGKIYDSSVKGQLSEIRKSLLKIKI